MPRIGWVVVVVVLASGCNQIFGLSATQPIDAAYFDAPADAPFACPPAGVVPRFSKLLHQAVFQRVVQYTTSATTMRAMGYGPAGVVEGPVDDVMTFVPGTGDPACLSCSHVDLPRLTPEGDGFYGVLSGMTIPAHLGLYRRNGNMLVEVHPFTTPLGTYISSVSRGPFRRIVIYGGDANFHEHSIDDTGGSSEILPPYTPLELGVESMHDAMLTADGLRMVFPGQLAGRMGESTFYADRPDLGSRFRTAVELAGIPVVDGAFVTEDCARIYLYGLDSVFYAQRQ
jgi:hypothetical protein